MPCHPPWQLRFRFVAAMDELNTMFKIASNKMFKHCVFWMRRPRTDAKKPPEGGLAGGGWAYS